MRKPAKRSALFTFALDAAERVTFECKLDTRRWRACSSPYRLRSVKPGRHRLRVRAEDQSGRSAVAVRRWGARRR
jgi:hypothetical protein